MALAIERLDPAKSYGGMKSAGKAHGFDCGLAVINAFVAGALKQQVKAGTSTAWVVTDDSKMDTATQQPFFVGFYTLTMAHIDQSMLAPIASGSLPRLVPCTRLVMLGVDKGYKGQGLGKRLMKHALKQTAFASGIIGCRGMRLDADPGALNFYLSLGFHQLSTTLHNGSYPMFIFRESFPPDPDQTSV